ncbi:hypothetical protein Q4555_12560 [Octadecabacter sp. 1_MG-2023]|uniref:hypothetical protein n=1 Tax=unclassified Octadecabacter TaxID=196158 RepID=UPI001C0914EE|nr:MULTISPECIES: hypothetical protein [unclassified Octadecabacter]MBU2993652.1 hypothetical protein [Octadecabacter sp. B2R22]MDO6735504.1 hypothetical protein [Octadecabacter sp. 1_MG-2023]
MTNKIWSSHLGVIATGAGLIGAAIYLLMVRVTLAHIQAVSGQIAFDMRPLGYGVADAVALLDALGEEGRSFYLHRQIPLDTLYPALMAVTLVATFCWLGRRIPNGRTVRLGVTLSIGTALFDYLENLGVIAMILQGPNVSVPLVYVSSAASIAKSGLTTAAVVLLLYSVVVWMWRARGPFRH